MKRRELLILLVSGLWVRLLSPVLNEVNRFTPPI